MAIKTVLDDRGDLSAEPGSAPWAVAVKLELQYLLLRASSAQKHIYPYLDKIEETGGYKNLINEDGQSFKSALEFYEAPEPWGLGNSVKIKDRIEKLGPQGRPKKGEKPVYSQVKYGTGNKPYILARLVRDHPEISEAFERGEYRSARQAGIAAGFVKDVKRIQVLPDPKKIAIKLKERLTTEQITEVIALLKE